MFTGLIQGLGEIESIRQLGQERRFRIKPLFDASPLVDGESIAINGVCLSVEKHLENIFYAYASAETLGRTSLGKLRPGAKVNLEKAVMAGERLGGHIMSGHVDCLAILVLKEAAGQSQHLRLTFPEEFSSQVVQKGSIALDGISLTVNRCGCGFLEVNIIPDSLKRSNISFWRIGQEVNMETDILAKYVERRLDAMFGKDGCDKSKASSQLTESFLAANGFF